MNEHKRPKRKYKHLVYDYRRGQSKYKRTSKLGFPARGCRCTDCEQVRGHTWNYNRLFIREHIRELKRGWVHSVEKFIEDIEVWGLKNWRFWLADQPNNLTWKNVLDKYISKTTVQQA